MKKTHPKREFVICMNVRIQNEYTMALQRFGATELPAIPIE